MLTTRVPGGRVLAGAVLAGVLLAGSGVANPAAGAGGGGGAAGGGRGELLVAFRADAASSGTVTAAAHRAAGASAVRRLPGTGIDVVAVGDVDRALAAYGRRADVRFAERNGTVHAATAPDDPLYPKQWNMQPDSAANKGTSDAESAWAAATGKDVVVAVLDTGVRPGGGDLGDSGRILAGYDFVNDDADPDDDDGHGTHVAGSIAQTTNNASGVAGVAPLAKILPGKILDENGSGDYATVIEGVNWAVTQGAKVINLSLAGSTASTALCDAVAAAAVSAVVVAASGNAGVSTVSYPAVCTGAIAVGAVRYDGLVGSYSNRGTGLDMVAPGGDSGVDQNADGQIDVIVQQSFTFSFGFRVWGWQGREGTSMASAHVSGAAALVRGLSPSSDARAVLLATARDLGSAGYDTTYGAGALDAGAAVASVPQTNPSPLPGAGAPTTTTSTTTVPGATTTTTTLAAPPPTTPSGGYREGASDGGIFAFGDAKFFGSMGGKKLSAPIVGMAPSPTGKGYWLVASDGGIFAFGDAKFFGSMGGKKLSLPIVGIAPSPTGNGYWLVASDGGIFAFGDAKFFGSMGGKVLSAPIVGIAPSPTGKGYSLVASDGGIFAFGDAKFFGSMGGKKLSLPIVGIAPSPTGNGYWLVASDGGIFAFGDAKFFGSMGGKKLSAPVVGIG